MKDTSYTYTSEEFAADVVFDRKNKRKSIKFLSERYYKNFVNTKLKIGDRITIVVTNKKPKRTLAQNAYYWGVYIPLISAETGEENIHTLHSLFKKFFDVESTSNLSVQDFCKFILQIEALTKVEAPPTENYHLAPLKRK